MLSKIAPAQADELMLGFETSDDAAVYRLSDDTAGLFTVDFFTPIVDDPYDFGRITAANALSDIYAMGGKPLVVLNLLAMPCSLGAEIVGEVVRGGGEKVAEAGALTVGGHTIDDAEPKFGLSVFGTVASDKVLYNRGAQSGDVIVLTKPIGTGIYGTALKNGRITRDELQPVVESMAHLNRWAAEATEGLTVHACTDVTGFGIAGHLHEMAAASDVSASVDLSLLPLFDRTWELAEMGVVPGRTAEIVSWARDFLECDESTSPLDRMNWSRIICDPQTSGGLLLAMPPAEAERYVAALASADPVSTPVIIGSFSAGRPGSVSVHLSEAREQ